jgi:hypothetical protein
MIFAAETETRELLVFPSEEEATSYCEGLDVEAAIWLFWDEAGNPLEPEFSMPSKRGWFSVENGIYHLVPAAENHHAELLEALESGRAEKRSAFRRMLSYRELECIDSYGGRRFAFPPYRAPRIVIQSRL